jgi:hypothetical protein
MISESFYYLKRLIFCPRFASHHRRGLSGRSERRNQPEQWSSFFENLPFAVGGGRPCRKTTTETENEPMGPDGASGR